MSTSISGANGITFPDASSITTSSTPAQFDNDTSVATTAFVQSMIGNASGVNAYSASTTLTTTQAGQELLFAGSTASQTLTLPSLSSLSIGASYHIQNLASVSVTIASSGIDAIVTTSPGVGSASASSIILAPGDSFRVVSAGTGWYEQTAIRSAALGASSITATGYQKLPSGLIIQWGVATSTTTVDVTATFPIVFPTAALQITLGSACVSGLNSPGYNTLTTSSVKLNCWSAATTRSITQISYIVIGS
jgi:hypothetical protein